MQQVGLTARARILYALAARTSATSAHTQAANVGVPAAAGSLITGARELRRQAQHLIDLSVMAERAAGTSWAVIAERLSTTEVTARARYEDLYVEWSLDLLDPDPEPPVTVEHLVHSTIKDPNPTATALALDAWVERHAEAGHPAPANAVSSVLA